MFAPATRRLIALGSAALLLVFARPAVTAAQPRATVSVPRIEAPPAFEDFLDMDPERTGPMARLAPFLQLEPDEGREGTELTMAWLGYTDTHLYVVVYAFDRNPGNIRARLTGRDQIYDDDRVFVWLDTMGDRRNAVALGVNPLNVQGDFAFADPDGFDTALDVVYDSRAALTPKGYVAWFAIPFRSLRFSNTPVQQWGVMVERTIAHKGESLFWPGLSSRIEGRARQLAVLDGIRDVRPGGALQFIPYASTASTTHPAAPRADELRFGVDAKAVLRQSLVLDATVRPDFSQIESDESQLLANERFELTLTERRPFFLENATLLRSSAGSEHMQLFFSRRIVEPDAGVRLTGRVGPWVLGSLVAVDRGGLGPSHAADADDTSRAAAAVGVLRRDLPGRSDIGLIATTRTDRHTANHVAAIEGRFALTPSWSVQALLAGSQSTDRAIDHRATGSAAAVEAAHEGRHLRARTRYLDIADAFRADLGFIPRRDIRLADQLVRWYCRPGGRIVSHGPTSRVEYVWNTGGDLLDWTAEAGWEITFTGPTTIGFTRREQRETFLGHRFRKAANEVRFLSYRLGVLTGESTFTWGTDVNHAPASGAAPVVAPASALTVTATVRPTRGLRVDQSVLVSKLRNPAEPSQGLLSRAWRSTVAWQLTPGWAVRAILERRDTDAPARWSSAHQQRSTTIDLLLSYRLGPGTALYVGYANATDVDAPAGQLLPAPDASRQHRLFVKASYLIWR